MKFRISATLVAAAFAFGAGGAFAADSNTTCPIMVEDEIDEEEFVEYEGKKVYFCCSSCVKAWDKNPKYFIKANAEALPQFKGMEAKLGLDKIELMGQRYCALAPDSIVTPESPSVEYKGKKIYFFKSRSVKKWAKDPEAAFKKATEAGLLPQFAENKKVEGKTNKVEKKG